MEELGLFSDFKISENKTLKNTKVKSNKSISKVESNTILYGDLLYSRMSKKDYPIMISYLETIGSNTFDNICKELDKKEIRSLDNLSNIPDESDRWDLSSDILFWFLERWPEEDIVRLRYIFDFCRRGRSKRLIRYILKK